jgi:molybdate transport system ATP-binding protein
LNLQFSVKLARSRFSLSAEGHFTRALSTAVTGPSGSGKSSWLEWLCGLQFQNSGRILWTSANGKTKLWQENKSQRVPPEERQIGYVPAQPTLFPWMTVSKNLEFGLKRNSKPVSWTKAEVLELCEIHGLENCLPSNLSNGEKQRVALGRALLRQPQLLIMDEAVSAQDRPRRHRILKNLKQLLTHKEIPVIFSTHLEEDLRLFADQVVWIQDGKLQGPSSIQDYLGHIAKHD